jgi:hypothetical protein
MTYTTEQLDQLSRTELQQLAKQHGIRANQTSLNIINQLITNAALTQNAATNTNLHNKINFDTTINTNNDVRLQDQKRLNQPFSIDDQVSSDVKSSDHTGSRINDYYHVDLVTVSSDNKLNNINKKNKKKFIKPKYKQSLLQRIKENPPVRSNSFQGIDYWVNKCVITIPDNPTGIKLRKLLSFEIEKIVIDLHSKILCIYFEIQDKVGQDRQNLLYLHDPKFLDSLSNEMQCFVFYYSTQ